MARTCGSCGRAWTSTAAFCGACGALLDPSVAARPDTTRTGRGSSIWRHLARPGVGWAGAVVVVVAAVVAVPALTVERTPPVDGEIDVPEGDELQAAPAAVPPRPRAPAPEVTCEVDGDPVPCVRWSRELLPPEDLEHGWRAWPTVVGDRVLLSSVDEIEMVDAVDGTRGWRAPVDMPHLVDVDEDVAVVVSGGDVTLLDLVAGLPRWATRAVPTTWGDALLEDVVVMADAPATLVGRDRDDGRPRWRWEAPWQDGFGLSDLGGGRLLVTSGATHGMAVLDTRTGEEQAVTDQEHGWLVGITGDVAIGVDTPPQHRPGRAGDPGATLRGIDLRDLSIIWEQEVPASDVSFAVVDGFVLAPSARHLTALQATSGQLAWERELPATTEIAIHVDDWFPGLGVGKPDVVVTHDPAEGTISGHDPASGAVRWEHRTSANPEHVVVGGRDVVVHARGSVEVLDADSGRARVRILAPPDASLVGLDPTIVAHDASGHVVRLELP